MGISFLENAYKQDKHYSPVRFNYTLYPGASEK